MAIKRLICKRLCGDSTLKAPADYYFVKVTPKDYADWISILTEPFGIGAPELYHDMVYPKIAAYLVKLKDKIVGCVALSNMSGFPHIMYLWIDPDHRRKRLAWFLVNMCILRAKANGYFEVRAIVDDGNLPALELFTKLGFEEMPVYERPAATPIVPGFHSKV